MGPLENLYQQFKDKGFVVVGLESWSRAGPHRLEYYRKQYGITFPLLYDGPIWGVPARGSPTAVLFDRTGRVVAYSTGGESDWNGASFRQLITILVAR